MEAHKQEIHATRVGGLGGSDAAMVLKIGRKGIESLSESDKIRLAVMTGQIQFKPIATNDAMERGNEFEKWLGENIYTSNTGWKSNPKINLTHGYSFKVFAHPDFFSKNIVIEAKCTSKDIVKTEEDYEAQLQWYYMLGINKVYLAHVLQSDDFELHKTKLIQRNSKTIYELRTGLQLIDAFIQGWTYESKEEWTDGDLMPFEKTAVERMYNSLAEIKRLEAKIETYKADLLKVFEDNNVKSLKSENYSISYVGESVTRTLDKSKLFKEHPEINEGDYSKTTVKKPYLKITLK